MVVKTNIDITFANNRCFDLSLAEFIIYFHYTQGRREGGVPGVTTPGPGPKRGPDTNCYKFTSTARYEVKLIAD